MQPLKRFTQCGSLTMLFVVFIVLFGVSSTALTTFGKTNPNQLQPPTTPPVKGRECNTHSDCATLQDTSCVKDREDGKTRCLCGDNNAPYNGQCNAKFKGLRHLCTQTNDCLEAMVCAVDNSTKTFGLSKLISSQQEKDKPKQCLCDEANGYQENVKELYCSEATTHIITNVLGPLLSVIVSFITSSPSVQFHSYH